jgi:hypothetical protein
MANLLVQCIGVGGVCVRSGKQEQRTGEAAEDEAANVCRSRLRRRHPGRMTRDAGVARLLGGRIASPQPTRALAVVTANL